MTGGLVSSRASGEITVGEVLPEVVLPVSYQKVVERKSVV